MFNKYNSIKLAFRDNYRFNSSVGIVISTLAGSIAVMVIMMNGYNLINWIQIGIAVFICSIYNAAVLSVQSYKIIFNLIITSLVYNIIVIILNLAI